MPKNKFPLFLSILISLAIGMIIWSTLSQPGVQNLEGDFEEVAFYRNENNTGPIIRLYAVSLGDTLWQQMRQYGDFMPHTKYGTTKVFFFLKGSPIPHQLQAGRQNLEERYQPYCIGLYEKNNMGQVSLIRYPFLQK